MVLWPLPQPSTLKVASSILAKCIFVQRHYQISVRNAMKVDPFELKVCPCELKVGPFELTIGNCELNIGPFELKVGPVELKVCHVEMNAL